MTIGGKTKIIALIGYPVEQSLSPAMHNAAFERLGLDYCYVAFPVRPEYLGEAVMAVRALGMAGINVTVPHKENVIPFLDEIDGEAADIGAVNTIVNINGHLKGYNTDGRGFMRGLSEEGISPEGKKILIIGAGGASKAVSYYLSKDAERLYIFDIDGAKAGALAKYLSDLGRRAGRAESPDIAADMDIVINATLLGLKAGDPLPCDVSKLGSSHIVGDLIYKETPLLREASKRGCKTFNGLGMLLWQGVSAFELWTGKTPPHELMREALLKGVK